MQQKALDSEQKYTIFNLRFHKFRQSMGGSLLPNLHRCIGWQYAGNNRVGTICILIVIYCKKYRL
jgi:hypothetical protein